MKFSFWFWPPFGSHFGGVLGAQMEAKAIKKPSQKNIKKMMPKMTPNWSQRGSQNGAKTVKNEVLEAPCFKDGSQVASRALQARFRRGFGTIWGPFSLIVLTYVWRFLHAFCSSMLQTETFEITRNHPKNAAESFQETTSLFVLSCIEKFTSERQWAFRSLLVQVETGQMSAVKTGQMPAAETGQMSAVETGQMSTVETR